MAAIKDTKVMVLTMNFVLLLKLIRKSFLKNTYMCSFLVRKIVVVWEFVKKKVKHLMLVV